MEDFVTKRLGMGGGSLLTQWIAKYGYVPIVLIGMAGLAPEIAREWKSGETIVAKAPVVAEAPVVARSPACGRGSCCNRGSCRASAAHAGNRGRAKGQDATGGTRPVRSIAGLVRSAGLEGLHHVRQLARVLDASAVARRDQRCQRRPAQQQHTRRDRAGSNAVRCRCGDDEGICQDRVLATIRKPRPANTSACSSFPTGSLPNTGMATSTTSATARSRRPESLRLRPRSSRRTSVVRPRRQNSTASTSKGIKAVRFITTRHSSWHGRTCT